MNAKQRTPLGKSSSGRPKANPRPVAAIKQPAQSAQPVLFEFHDRGARKVCIAGSFNDWRPDCLEMIDLGNGKWAKKLLLPLGTYEYRLVVDGKWICDPSARMTTLNPFGELNSVVQVANNRDTLTSGPARKRESPRSRPWHARARS